jgi:hypothetical protein
MLNGAERAPSVDRELSLDCGPPPPPPPLYRQPIRLADKVTMILNRRGKRFILKTASIITTTTKIIIIIIIILIIYLSL